MPRDPADALREDRIRLTHMLEAAQRVERRVAGTNLDKVRRPVPRNSKPA